MLVIINHFKLFKTMKKLTKAEHIKRAEYMKSILKTGDRIRVTKCPGTKRVITFSHFDGFWIVSKSGIDDYSPSTVDKINGVDFAFD